jgi:ubiquinone/menaquinone biosynthesis C-methylase UbiE
MSDEPDIGAFSSVDRKGDPTWFISLMDMMDREPLVITARDVMKSAIDPQPGDTTLDVGCGPGSLVLEFAKAVGAGGRAVGLDSSEAMVDEAQRRARELGAPAEFRVGSADDLPFEAGTFTGCTAERVCQHVKDPARVISELARVTRKGGRVAASDADWGSAVLDAPDHSVTRRVLDFWCDSIASGWVGRQHPALFASAGLTDIQIHPQVWVWRKFKYLDAWGFTETLERAAIDKVISEGEKGQLLEHLHQADDKGRFFYSVTAFVVSGTKS